MPTQTDIDEMAEKIALEHSCRVEHAGQPTAQVRLRIWGKQPEFQVESFRLIGHPKANTAFAWKFPNVQRERSKPPEIITRLKCAKLVSPVEAVCEWADIKWPDELGIRGQ